MKRIPIPVSMTFTIWFCTALILFQSGCKDKSVDAPIKNAREFSFTIDTLKNSYPGSFQTTMLDIWGTDPKNVYVVGGSSNDRCQMWHFDGNQWTEVKLITVQGGPIPPTIDLYSIHGFSRSDIWAVGERYDVNPHPPPNFIDSTLIIHYDGTTWREVQAPPGGLLMSIHGRAPNDIWACGWQGTLLHYDGVTWRKDTLPLPTPTGAYVILRSLAVALTGEVFMTGSMEPGWEAAPSRTLYLFHRMNGRWIIADSVRGAKGIYDSYRWGDIRMWASPQGSVYSANDGVFRWSGQSWTKVFSKSAIEAIGGASDNDLFIAGTYGAPFHFNGSDWFEFSQLYNGDTYYTALWYDGREVFLVNSDAVNTFIYHGR
jgi:hypothetical protein